jgi:hypothetical protein
VGKHFTAIAVNQVCQGMTLRFRCWEMPTIQYSVFSDLCSFLGFRELNTGSGLGSIAFPSHLYPINCLAIWTYTLVKDCHADISRDTGDTAWPSNLVDQKWTIEPIELYLSTRAVEKSKRPLSSAG